jgi:hypothetical protein
MDKDSHHFYKAFQNDDAIHIAHVHFSEIQKYLLFARVIMLNHETCNLMRWYECMNIFHACISQAAWFAAHLLDVFVIWFAKPPKEPPDLMTTPVTINDCITTAIHVSPCNSIQEQVDDKECPHSPPHISRPSVVTYEVNHKLSTRWNTRKRIEYPAFFPTFFSRGTL